jgi:NitT/TauT family transport system permease protein
VEQDSSIAKINVDSLLQADSARFANATEFVKVYPLLPPPDRVVKSFSPLLVEDGLAKNTGRSVWLNLQGYFWALVIAIPLGFLIGLFPIFRGLFSKQVNAMRYLPLTALTGLFILWFGIEDQMKIAFLAFGIIVYLLPVVVQRIDEVEDVYLKTVFTLGATNWQTIRTVYLPAVMSELMDDIRVLTAISWTYIIIAELLNRQGGIGSLIYIKARQGQVDRVFAVLLVIILIGFIQDRLFVYMDRRLFPHKYYKTTLRGIRQVELAIGALLLYLAVLFLLPVFGVNLAGLGNTVGYASVLVGVACVAVMLIGELEIWQALKKSR